MKALSGGKKREVISDENARQEYLTGFEKRKQERRKNCMAQPWKYVTDDLIY